MAGGIDWFRWHHGTTGDRKFPLVAKRAGARLGDVLAMWAILLEQASAADDRGNPGSIDFDSIDLALDMPEGAAQAIHAAMVDRKLIDGATGRLMAWEKRQPKRERPDDNSTERSRAHRATQRQLQLEDGDATPCNATQRTETPREEESREEENSSLRSESQSCAELPADFLEAWAAYPKRAGGNSRQNALKAWQARIKAGASPEAMLAGVKRYAAFCEATGKVGTEYVQQGATFFGPGEHFLAAWDPPAVKGKRPGYVHDIRQMDYTKGVDDEGRF